MSWKLTEDFRSSPEHDAIKEFLLKEEYSCLDITSLLAAADYDSRKEEYRLLFHTDRENKPDAVLFMTGFGKLIPVFAEGFIYRRRYTQEIISLLGDRLGLLNMISGKPKAAEVMAGEFAPSHDRLYTDYYIMQLTRDNFMPPLPSPGTGIHRGSILHLPFLLPLQKAYELEEVLLNPDYYDFRESVIWLKNILTRETCFYARTGFRYSGKANTNARGFKHIQIGGVFTHRDFRGKRIGKNTVAALCSHLFSKEDMNISLFVKQDNAAAVKAYTDLGFRIVNRMRTIYFY